MGLGAQELSPGFVPKMTCAARGVSSVKLRLMIAIPLSQVPMAFLVPRDGGMRLPSHWKSRSTLPPQQSTAVLVATSTSPCSFGSLGGSCWSVSRGVGYLESCQLIVKRLWSEILLQVLMFGQLQLTQKPGLMWGSVPCSESSPHFTFSRSLLDALIYFFPEKQLAKTLTLLIYILLSSQSWRT